MYRFESTYKVRINDDLGSPTYWNSRLQDIDLRLNTVEGYAATINDAVDQVITQGLNRVNSTITPLVNTLTTNVNTLTAEVAALQGTVITDQNSVVNQLNALLATAQGLIANLQSLGTVSDGTF